MFIGYHIAIARVVRRNPDYTLRSVVSLARASWVKNIMTSEGKEVLAVQTLRNSTMAAVFLASTAIMLMLAVMSLSAQND